MGVDRPQYIWMFPKIGVPQNGWFIMENPIRMDDLGVPLFLKTPIWTHDVLYPKNPDPSRIEQDFAASNPIRKE